MKKRWNRPKGSAGAMVVPVLGRTVLPKSLTCINSRGQWNFCPAKAVRHHRQSIV